MDNGKLWKIKKKFLSIIKRLKMLKQLVNYL